MSEYRVNLDIYNGPLDLLLYLIRREEVDIHDISIARITEQYVKYVEMLQKLDPNLAGEFLVLASTLMEIKTQILLPTAESEDGENEGLEIDPRTDLIRQLLQYKAFKDTAQELQQSAEIQSLKFPRKPGGIDFSEGDQPGRDMEDLQIWDLFDAFRSVMDSIGQMGKYHEVIYDDTPLELYKEDLLDRLQRDGNLSFGQIFEGRGQRAEMIGLFLAMLELMKLRMLRAFQDDNFLDIQIELNPNPPTVEELEAEMAAIKQQQQGQANTQQASLPDDDNNGDNGDDFDDDNDSESGGYISESSANDVEEDDLEDDYATEDFENEDFGIDENDDDETERES